MIHTICDVTLSEVADFNYGKMPNKELLNQGSIPTYSGYKYQHRYPEHNCEEGDVIVVARGVGGTGDVKLVRERCYLTNLSIKIHLDNTKVDNKFFYYYFLHRGLKYLDSGSAQSQLTIADLSNVQIALPQLKEQKAIAHILGTLDDKIELNRQTNKTLESIAQTIFKSWFVDFDPVRAKRDGKTADLSLSREILDLFPDSFQDSELGEIPVGWEVCLSGDLFPVKDGTHDSPKRKDEGYHLVTSKHIIGDIIDLESAYLISEEDYININKRSKVDRFDTLITMIGTVGETHFISEEPEFAIKNIGLFKTSQTPELAYYFYQYLSSQEIQQYLFARLAGTTQSYLTLKSLRAIPVLQPTNNLLDYYNRKITPLYEAISLNNIQSMTLGKLRNTLLPKLISGELRIKDAEKFLKDAPL